MKNNKININDFEIFLNFPKFMNNSETLDYMKTWAKLIEKEKVKKLRKERIEKLNKINEN